MSNRNLSIGRSYWLQTSYLRYQAVQELKLRTEPESFLTASPHLGRLPLSMQPLRSLGPAEPLHQERSGEHLSPLVKLTTLLHLTLGLIRYEYGSVRPFHRGAPSARCLYSTELFVLPADRSWLGEEGAYRYDPLLHALERRQEGPVWDALEDALGLSLDGAEGALVLGADCWRIARLYADFAYNLATLEAGHAIAQLNVLASRLGYATTVHERFLDRQLIELLRMNGNAQAPLAVVVLWPQEKAAPAVEQERIALQEIGTRSAVSTRFEQEIGQCAELTSMMEASRLHHREELLLTEEEAFDSVAAHEHSADPCTELTCSAQQGRMPDLVDAIKSRNSGNDSIGLAATGRPIQFAELAGLLRELAAHPDVSELASEVGVYLVAHRVTGLQSGIYQFDLSRPALCPLAVQAEAGRLIERASVVDGKFINFRSLPVAFYFTVDAERALRRHGNRGFQISQMKVGRITHYLCLLAAAHGWFARPLKSYRDAEAEAMLGLSETTKMLAYQLVMGENHTPYLEFDMGL